MYKTIYILIFINFILFGCSSTEETVLLASVLMKGVVEIKEGISSKDEMKEKKLKNEISEQPKKKDSETSSISSQKNISVKKTAYIKENNVEMYSTPYRDGVVVNHITAGSKVLIFSIQDNWVNISADEDREYWINDKSLCYIENCWKTANFQQQNKQLDFVSYGKNKVVLDNASIESKFSSRPNVRNVQSQNKQTTTPIAVQKKSTVKATAKPTVKTTTQKQSSTVKTSHVCDCSGSTYCVGPRGGHFCYTSGGNKRYLPR